MDSIDSPKKTGTSTLLYVVLLAVVGAILFALIWVNRHTTHVNLILWDVQMRVFVLVPCIFLLGFLGGWAFKTLVSPRRTKG